VRIASAPACVCTATTHLAHRAAWIREYLLA
jgi:hypothetical protein